MRHKPFGEIWFVVEHPHHGGLIHSGDYRVLQRRAGRNTPRPFSQTTLADKISRFEECDDCFLALARNASRSNLDFDFWATTEFPSARQSSVTLSPNRQRDGKTCRGSHPTRR